MRSFWRHEKLAIQLVLATAQHQPRAEYKNWAGLRRAVVDVSVIMQLMFQQSTVEFFKVPQLQFIDRVVDILVA